MMSFSFSAPRFQLNDFRKEMESMSDKEREIANHDLRGSLKPIEEVPDFVFEKLVELKMHVDLDTKSDKAAYDEAHRRIPNLVNSVEFLLTFLRATRFDTKLAAKKLINYWECKLELFGPEVAFRQRGRIEVSDLNNSDLASLKCLGMSCLPKDNNNRGVLFFRRQNWIMDSKQPDGKNLMRLVWYLLQVMTEDPGIQRKGVVIILNNFGEFSTDHYNQSVELLFGKLITNAFPCHIAGLHLCYDSKFYELFLPFVLYSFGREIRSRLRLHTYMSSLWESLEECGLPKEYLPLQFGGSFLMDVNTWRRERDRIEKQMYSYSPKTVIETSNEVIVKFCLN